MKTRLLVTGIALLAVCPIVASQIVKPEPKAVAIDSIEPVHLHDHCARYRGKLIPAGCKHDPDRSLTARTVLGDTIRLHRLDFPAGVKSPHHSHAGEEMFYILSGRFRVVSGDKEFELVPGDVFTAPAYVDHQFEALVDSSLIEAGGPGPTLGRIAAIEQSGE
ncbi:MAG: cupin domain-containing protein [Pseudomonadota bacterium]